jgi:hypothetical protein
VDVVDALHVDVALQRDGVEAAHLPIPAKDGLSDPSASMVVSGRTCLVAVEDRRRRCGPGPG